MFWCCKYLSQIMLIMLYRKHHYMSLDKMSYLKVYRNIMLCDFNSFDCSMCCIRVSIQLSLKRWLEFCIEQWTH